MMHSSPTLEQEPHFCFAGKNGKADWPSRNDARVVQPLGLLNANLLAPTHGGRKTRRLSACKKELAR